MPTRAYFHRKDYIVLECPFYWFYTSSDVFAIVHCCLLSFFARYDGIASFMYYEHWRTTCWVNRLKYWILFEL